MISKDETKIIINERIAKLNEVILYLKQAQKLAKDEFLRDQTRQHAIMYELIVGIESICDIGSHILAKYYSVKCEHYKDIIINLGKYKIIPKSLAKASAKMADFRNVLIHLYVDVGPKEVYVNFQKAPKVFAKFAQYFLKFLKRYDDAK